MKYWIDKNILEHIQDRKWFWRFPFKFFSHSLLKIDAFAVQREIHGRILLDRIYLSKERAEEVYESNLEVHNADNGELVLWTHSDWGVQRQIKRSM